MTTFENVLSNTNDIKQEIQLSIGKNIVVKLCNKQGKTLKEYIGVIDGAYNKLFLVKMRVGAGFINKTFSYVDFVTGDLSYEIT